MNSIQHYRKKAGLTQEELASRCQWEGNSRISNYETGIRAPGIDELKTIRAALASCGIEVSLDQLAEAPPAEDAAA